MATREVGLHSAAPQGSQQISGEHRSGMYRMYARASHGDILTRRGVSRGKDIFMRDTSIVSIDGYIVFHVQFQSRRLEPPRCACASRGYDAVCRQQGAVGQDHTTFRACCLLIVHDHDEGYGIPVARMCEDAARETGLAVRSRPGSRF